MNCLIKIAQLGKSTIGPVHFNCEHGHCLAEFGAVACPHGDASVIPLFGCVLCRGELERQGLLGLQVLPEEFATCATMVQELASEQAGAPKNLGDAISYLVKKEPRIQGEQVLVQTVLGYMIEAAEAIEAAEKTAAKPQ